MITNIQKYFVMFVTLCLVVVFIPTTAVAASESKFQRPSWPFNKYQEGSKRAAKDSGWLSRKKSHSKNQSEQAGDSNSSELNNLWHAWKKRNDQRRTEQHNPKQKQINNRGNQNSGHKQKKQKSQQLNHPHQNEKSFSQHHNGKKYSEHRQESHNSHKHEQHREYRHQPNNSKTQIAINHNHKHRPNHNHYGRHKHIYYRTPWYNTRYIAPIHYHYHPIGHRVRYLPKLHVSVVVGGFSYFYFGGVFYQPFGSSYIVVGAPIGALVSTLPAGFIAFSIGPSTFYYINDTYYVWDEPRQGYFVIEKPAGADRAIEEATTGRLFAYPKQEQSEEQQAKDRYECHRWAVTESRVDPTLEDEELSTEEKTDYQRAIGACLEGRGYAVK